MRLLLATIMLAMLGQPVWAFSLGELYRFCEPYADNGMSISGLSEPAANYSFVCLGYHAGVMHSALAVCSYSESSVDKAAFGTSITDPNEVISRFMTYAKDARDDWEALPFPPYWLNKTCKK